MQHEYNKVTKDFEKVTESLQAKISDLEYMILSKQGRNMDTLASPMEKGKKIVEGTQEETPLIPQSPIIDLSIYEESLSLLSKKRHLS